MGRLLYGVARVSIEFDDRTLRHLQVVIGEKLRNGEGFYLSWKDDSSVGEGRSAIWLEQSIPLFFSFGGQSPGSDRGLNAAWLDELMIGANGTSGLFLGSEPGRSTPRPRSHMPPPRPQKPLAES